MFPDRLLENASRLPWPEQRFCSVSPAPVRLDVGLAASVGTEASLQTVRGTGFRCEPASEPEQKRKTVMAITVFAQTGAAQQFVSGSMAELAP